MSHFKLSGQPDWAKLTLEVSIVTEFRGPSHSLPDNSELKADTDITKDRRVCKSNSGNGNELK